MNAAYFYVVRYWIAPEAEARVIAWTDGGHMAEVAAHPGFRWARRVRLEEVDSLGWRAFTNFYGLDSKAALDGYFASPIREKIGREQAAFADVMRSERSWGAVEHQAGPDSPEPFAAPYYHVLRFWTAPQAEQPALAWTDGKHAPELVTRPDHLWAKRIRLAETDSLGWRAFSIVYGMSSKAALDAYIKDPVRQRYGEEQKPLVGQMRVERSRGGSEFLTVR